MLIAHETIYQGIFYIEINFNFENDFLKIFFFFRFCTCVYFMLNKCFMCVALLCSPLTSAIRFLCPPHSSTSTFMKCVYVYIYVCVIICNLCICMKSGSDKWENICHTLNVVRVPHSWLHHGKACSFYHFSKQGLSIEGTTSCLMGKFLRWRMCFS